MSNAIVITINYMVRNEVRGMVVYRTVDGRTHSLARLYPTQEEALDAIKGAQRADRAAASRLGITVKHTAG